MQRAIKPGNKPAKERQGYKRKELSKKYKRDRDAAKYCVSLGYSML